MAKMTVRTTFALDEETAGDIKGLAGKLGVSQAEVVRKSIKLMVEQNEKPVITAADVIEFYRTNPPTRTEEEYQAMLDELKRERESVQNARVPKYGWSNE